MNEQMALFNIKRETDAKQRRKRKWENDFQKWSNKAFGEEDNTLGVCGYGSMCDYCEDNSYGRPCVRALNAMLRETGESIDYESMSFEDVWEGARA